MLKESDDFVILGVKFDFKMTFEGRCFFIGLSCSIPTIFFYYLSLSLLSVYRMVLCCWGLRTHRVYLTLFQPCTADLF